MALTSLMSQIIARSGASFNFRRSGVVLMPQTFRALTLTGKIVPLKSAANRLCITRPPMVFNSALAPITTTERGCSTRRKNFALIKNHSLRVDKVFLYCHFMMFFVTMLYDRSKTQLSAHRQWNPAEYQALF